MVMSGDTYDLLRVLTDGKVEVEPLSIDQAFLACQRQKGADDIQLQGRDLNGDWWELDPSTAERLYRLEG